MQTGQLLNIGIQNNKLENLASLTGELANNPGKYSEYLSSYYFDFIKKFQNNPTEINIKIIIRAIIQSNIFPKNILDILIKFQNIYNSGLIGATLDEFIEKIKLNKKPQDIINKLSRSYPEINKTEIYIKKSNSEPSSPVLENNKFNLTIKFFDKLNILEFQDMLEDTILKISDNIKKYPQEKPVILRRIIICLLEFLYGPLINKIPEIISELKKIFNICEFDMVILDINIKSLDLDNPHLNQIWTSIIKNI